MQKFVLARFQPSNWLVRESRDIPYRDPERPFVERTTVQRRRWEELELAVDSVPLAQAHDFIKALRRSKAGGAGMSNTISKPAERP